MIYSINRLSGLPEYAVDTKTVCILFQNNTATFEETERKPKYGNIEISKWLTKKNKEKLSSVGEWKISSVIIIVAIEWSGSTSKWK